MKMRFNRCVVGMLICSLLFGAGCTGEEMSVFVRDIPALVRTDGTRDIVGEAVSLSGYADGGLSGLVSTGYGEGKFTDYLSIQANPLTAADYVLSAQMAARQLSTNGTGVSEFYRHILEKTGFRCETVKSYAVYTDLLKALKAVYTVAGKNYPESMIKEMVSSVSSKVRKPLACWLSAAAAAYALVREETKQVTEEQFAAVSSFTYTRCATSDTTDLEKMWQISFGISEEAMQRAGEILMSATAELSQALIGIQTVTDKNTLTTIPTPLGDVLLGSSGKDNYSSPNALLIVDPAGQDMYLGRIAAGSSLDNCLSVVVDLEGNDFYSAEDEPSQGCGILGVGILFDMQGNDTYFARRLAQGCSLIGAGVLYDGQGEDVYTCHVTGQASGFYGTAMLLDGSGDDIYNGYGFVQASAGNRCVAYLVDGSGNDWYDTPEDTPAEAEYSRLDYGEGHAGKAGNFSQGCGWGQRNIGENGLAGGIGGMIDFAGDDTYTGGLWVQGTGYWSGIGSIYNEGGNDCYQAYYYSQASVAHYGAGVIVDTSGNDTYDLSRGAGLSFVWDRGVSMLVDDRGADAYSCPGSHGGVANSAYDEKGVENQDLTYAFFLDAQGNDLYNREKMASEMYGFGRGGFFLDADGEDVYSNPFLWDNNSTVYGIVFQKGGVFLDAGPSEQGKACFQFWEEAKRRAGFSEILTE